MKMIGMIWEDKAWEGPDGQTQDGVCAYFDDQAQAERILKEISAKMPNFKFDLFEYELLINPTAEQIAKGFFDARNHRPSD